MNEINQEDEQREELKKKADMRYPECEKLAEVSPAPQIVGNFLDWLSNKKNLTLCEWVDNDIDEGHHHPYHYQIEELLAEFFEIDLVKVEQERRQMLEDLQK